MSSASTPRCSPRSGATPPTTLVPPPNGTTASEERAQSSSTARSCSWLAGVDHGVGRPLGLARAQAHEIGVALAGGVQNALVRVLADVLAPTISRSCRERLAGKLRSAAAARG